MSEPTPSQLITDTYNLAVAQERERCARIVETWTELQASPVEPTLRRELAKKIRSGDE